MATTSVFFGQAVAAPSALALNNLKTKLESSAASVPALAVRASAEEPSSRRQVLSLAAGVLAAGALFATPAKAGLIEDLLATSKANKELNDAKRLATVGANTARAYTVQQGTCQFPNNFTGCDDLAKRQNVKFITDDLDLECVGKEPGKCASNNLWNKNLPAPKFKQASANRKSSQGKPTTVAQPS
eukprot:SM000088S23748  [mRNA]  locus=s88:546897:547926:+ [translate_table: standard]